MYEIYQKMDKSDSVDSLKAILVNYFFKEGITSLAFTWYNKHTKTGNKLIYDWVSAPLKAWHQYYLEQGYADADRTLEASEQSLLPVFWDVTRQLSQAKNSREQRIRQESIDFGIDKGLCIPLHGAGGDFIVLVLHQRINESGLQDWEKKQFEWLAVTQCYFHFLNQLLTGSITRDSGLTRRERQCLELTAEGVRMEMIAANLGISLRTVNFHLQNANKKLGVSNKYLATMRWLSIK